MDLARRLGQAAPWHRGVIPRARGTGVGTLLRAEVETTLDGTTVQALLPLKGKGDVRNVERIEVIGTPKSGPDVNVVLASKGKRRRDDRGDGPRDGSRRPADRRPRSDSADRGPRSDSGSRGRPSSGGPSEDGGRKRTGPARPGGRDSGGRGTTVGASPRPAPIATRPWPTCHPSSYPWPNSS